MKAIIANLESLSALLDSISSLAELEPSEVKYLSTLISDLRKHQARLLAESQNSIALLAHDMGIGGALQALSPDPFKLCDYSVDYAPEEPLLSADEYLQRGLDAIASAHYDEAMCIFAAGVELYPEDPELLANLALSHWELGEMEKCAEVYLKAMEAACPGGFTSKDWFAYPEHTFLRSVEGRALALARLGERSQAIQLFKTLYSLNPTRYVGCIYLAGENLHLLGDTERALEAYSLSPEEPCVFYNKALAYFQLGNLEKAAETLIYAFALNPHVACLLLGAPHGRDGIIPGYLGGAAYAEDFIDACAPLWGSNKSLHFLERLFSNPLVENLLDSFDEDGEYVTADGSHHAGESILEIQAFTKDTEGIVKILLPSAI